MADYENVSRGSLKLKGVSDSGIKKKKSKKKKKEKDKEREKAIEDMVKSVDESSARKHAISGKVDKRTKAEIAFEKAQEKRQEELLLKKAEKSHKERILDFNSHLDSLTEHYDIPKVSWTK